MNYHDEARKYLKHSNCLRRHYACVIVKDGNIIAIGYNKSLTGCAICARKGMAHSAGDYSECHSIHAEQMALIEAKGEELQGSEIYLVCDRDPDYKICPICQRMLAWAGITLVREKEMPV